MAVCGSSCAIAGAAGDMAGAPPLTRPPGRTCSAMDDGGGTDAAAAAAPPGIASCIEGSSCDWKPPPPPPLPPPPLPSVDCESWNVPPPPPPAVAVVMWSTLPGGARWSVRSCSVPACCAAMSPANDGSADTCKPPVRAAAVGVELAAAAAVASGPSTDCGALPLAPRPTLEVGCEVESQGRTAPPLEGRGAAAAVAAPVAALPVSCQGMGAEIGCCGSMVCQPCCCVRRSMTSTGALMTCGERRGFKRDEGVRGPAALLQLSP